MTSIERISVERLAEYISPDVRRVMLAQADRIEELEGQLDEQEERIEELEAACEVVSSEFEGDLWQVCRRLLGKTGFDVRAHEPDGIQADVFEDHMNEILAQRHAALAAFEKDQTK